MLNLIFSVSPKHTDEYYGRKAGEAAALKPDYICLKDPGGLLTPERTAALIKVIQQQAPRISYRAPRPLHHRPGSAVRSRSGQTRRADHRHIGAAAGQRFF